MDRPPCLRHGRYTARLRTLRIISHGAGVEDWPASSSLVSKAEAGRLRDTDMARIAMENCLAWAVAFTRANPYDLRAAGS